MSSAPRADEFEFSGGALCLDLANTLGDRPRSTSERMGDYNALLRWSRQAKLLDEVCLAATDRLASAEPDQAEAVFGRAIELREAIYRLFAALAKGDEPAEEDLEILNGELTRALPNLRIRRQGDCCEWAWDRSGPSLDSMLWPVARSVADLLTSDEAVSIRECAAETCSWLFVDRSRSKRRKWCDMSICGNRAKARRHYQRAQEKRGRDSTAAHSPTGESN